MLAVSAISTQRQRKTKPTHGPVRWRGGQVADDMNPMRVLRLFRAISTRDAELLDMAGRPEDLVVTAVPVPPVVIRPSVEMDSGAGSNEDDCTMRLMARLSASKLPWERSES